MAVDRSISLHPEWELMYAAGLTVREISDRVGHPRSTVQRHLQVREQYSFDLRPVHEAACAARRPGWPNHRWRKRLAELAAFTAAHDRLPGRQGTPRERSLYGWLSEQRRARRRGTMHPAKVEALNQTWPEWATAT